MSGRTCKARTATGSSCRLKPGPSGYCHIHDPAGISERKASQQAAEEARVKTWAGGERLRQVIDVVQSTCAAKGWGAYVQSRDERNWRYATLSVDRRTTGEWITGIVEIEVDDGVQVRCVKTSFYGHGLSSLHDAIMAELGRLPWLEAPKKDDHSVSPTGLEKLLPFLTRFHRVVRQLQLRHKDRPPLTIEDEYDLQDLLHALLRVAFDDIRPEEHTPSYAGASSRMDFLLKKEGIVVETKMASATLTDKQIGEELIIDIKRYQSHPDCRTLVCFVYDPADHVRNPAGLENDLSRTHDKLLVRVLIVPH